MTDRARPHTKRVEQIGTFVVCLLGVIIAVGLIAFWVWALYIANT